MIGQINFRVHPALKNFYMFRQVVDSIVRVCPKCQTHWKGGEYEVCSTLSHSFRCMPCAETMGKIVNVQSVMENHFDHANIVIGISTGRFERLSNQIWFYFGKACKTRLKRRQYASFQQKAVAMYDSFSFTVKKSIETLCLCLLRLKIYKDLRQFIVKMIWPNEIICWLKE